MTVHDFDDRLQQLETKVSGAKPATSSESPAPVASTTSISSSFSESSKTKFDLRFVVLEAKDKAEVEGRGDKEIDSAKDELEN